MSTDSSPTDVVVLTGPTASGKTDLLDRVFGGGAFFCAHDSGAHLRFRDGREIKGVQVISADSMQVYRHMDIGTSKPDKELLSRLPHLLIDIKEPDEQYTAGDFVRLADALCLSLVSDGILPIISGGTGFYVKNFICGPPSGPQSDPGIREEVARDLASKGADVLRQELHTADPALASRIHAKDIYRLTRAIEIWRSSGKKPSSFAPGDTVRKNYRFLVAGIERPREEIKNRIDARVDMMMQRGLAYEVRSLEEAGFTAEDPGMKAIGYREFFEKPAQGEDAIMTLIKLHTRQYAKRQMTFFRSLPGICWIGPEAEQLSELVREFFSNGVESDSNVDSLS